jgi:hypothetical protein
LREQGGAAQQARAKVFPWQLEDVIQFLSKDGDSEVIYLWRERALRRSEGVPGADGEQTPSVAKKRKFVFFSCRIGTEIDPALESQELKDRVFAQYRECIQYEHYPRPETRHFTDELERIKAGAEDVSLHFSGHGDGRSGSLCWHGVAGRRQKEMQIRGKQLATLIKLKDAVAHIDSFFLNACCTLATGLELHAIGVRVVVCWQSPVTDRTARDFATRFYELSCRDSGQYAKAFETACNEMSGALLEARPCLLQTGSGQPERPGVQIWNGTELVPIADELLHSPHFLQPTAPPLELPGGAGLDSAPLESYVSRKAAEPEDYDDEEDVYKNWRPPNQDTDFAAHAGQAEKAVLQKLGFNLLLSGMEIGVLNGKEIGGSHGLDAQGFLTPDALRAIGIGNYTRLWRRSGKAVEEARKMLLHEKCSAAAREQVRLARNDLERSIFYRQLDVMAFRFPRLHTREWYEHKAALLKKGKKDIINEYRRDTEDRERMSRGEAVASTRKQELASACGSHLYQLDMRYETMRELQGLLLCQVRWCVCVCVCDREGGREGGRERARARERARERGREGRRGGRERGLCMQSAVAI